MINKWFPITRSVENYTKIVNITDLQTDLMPFPIVPHNLKLHLEKTSRSVDYYTKIMNITDLQTDLFPFPIDPHNLEKTDRINRIIHHK